MCLKFGGGGVDKVQGGEILKNIYIFNWSKSPPLPHGRGRAPLKNIWPMWLGSLISQFQIWVAASIGETKIYRFKMLILLFK